GYAVAQGIRSRIALVKEDWATAEAAAEEAIKTSGKKIAPVDAFKGLNSVSYPNVMWGAEVIADQAGMYASFFAHMDPAADRLEAPVSYVYKAPKQITPWLYDKIATTDARKAWWDPESELTKNYGGAIQQVKFLFSDVKSWLGDYIWMRVEEMYLTAAEAECRAGKEAEAKAHLMELMKQRDPQYTCDLKTGKNLGKLTTDLTGSLLEEIILQRRIELWGEGGRVYDIRRLKQGFKRFAADGWPSNCLLNDHPASANPENYLWVLTIPQAEFDGNVNMDINKDQNPLGDE
ncbi:MAG: RagB/SusD family nutrient uptake outer membrane protein, partial [Muribaculaceae bacterium]|nr:RagB/SusD family nutrient uptake outer membrane protein [Muribaculaceae bacterium]